jgi:hypothetical protein
MDQRPVRKNLQFNWLVIVLALPAGALACYLTGFNGLYGQEGHENYRYLSYILQSLEGHPALLYFQNAVLYPLLGAMASLFIAKLYSLQAISLVASGFCYIGFCRLLNLVYPDGRQRQRYAFLLLFMSPYFLRAAFSALPEMLAMSFMVWSLFFCVKWQRRHKIKHAALALGLAILAIETRYTLLFLLLQVLSVMVSVARKRLSHFLLLVFTGITAITPVILFKSTDLLDFLNHPWLHHWSPAHLIDRQSTFGNTYSLPNGLAVLALFVHPGFCFLSIPLLWISAKLPEVAGKNRLLITGLFSFLFFIACLPVQEFRLLLPALPLMLLLLYPAYERLVYMFKSRNLRVGLYLLATLLQLALCMRSMAPVIQLQREERMVASALRMVGEGRLITFEMDGALRTYGVPQEVVNLWFAPNPVLNAGDMLLIKPLKLETEYRDSPAYSLYIRLKQHRRLIYLRSIGSGWELYRIRP